MLKKIKIFIIIIIICNFNGKLFSKENFFEEAKKLYESNELTKSKFLFQRNIVFNPKDSESYLYLAKIYKSEEDEEEVEKNLDTSLLLKPDNEEALFMKINIELKRSNFDMVKKLIINFELICSKLCKKTKSINESLKNIEAKDES
jgi:tetratricopeptide (TPR) repeat protein